MLTMLCLLHTVTAWRHWQYMGTCQAVGQTPQCHIKVGWRAVVTRADVRRNRTDWMLNDMSAISKCRATVY
jgi:hypothetical protein